VIELSVDEARRLNHHYIDTEHLLLGLVREGEGSDAGVLESLSVSLDNICSQVIYFLNQSAPDGPGAEAIGITSGRPPSVDRAEGSTAVFLTFDGTREQEVRNRTTRVSIALSGADAARLWRLLGERLTDEEKTLD
jgi:ATP-dependent Clp protease ATP-binding subunit ClpA